MSIRCTFSGIGLHLLLLTHIAHTFVLLTANVEDVKKLARKFVSESLAEKIADFIAKATEQINTNMSEDTAMNEDSHQVSEENNMYNIGRQGDSAAQEVLKSREDKPDDVQSQSASFESTPRTEFDLEKPDRPAKNIFPGRLEGPSLYAPVEPLETAKQYAYPLQDQKPSKISEEDENYDKEIKRNKYLGDNFVTTAMPSLFSENFAHENKLVRNKAKGRPYRLLSHANTDEENEINDNKSEKNGSIDDFFAQNLFQKRSMDLTTRKAVFEFDQYENKNYPKAKFVATSGPVALPEMPKDKWWEKELPTDKSKNTRKNWF